MKYTVMFMFLWLMLVNVYADGAHPQGIKLDGTIGIAGKIELPGPDYQIISEYGKQAGSNLFHSFQQFNIHSGESATFSGPDSVKNIISRVTGGSASWIDGKLASTIPNADMYFLNPFGIMFGSNASLDLKGSFHVSTADYLKMGDNERFYSMPQQNEVLSVAAPMAFGFLSATPGSISAEGSLLYVPNGKTISVIGGDILFHNAAWVAWEGRIILASAASPGEIRQDDIGISGIEKQGNISIIRDAESSGNHNWADLTASAGEIVIRAGRFELRGGAISTNNYGNSAGKDIDICVTDDMLVNGAGISYGGSIAAKTYGSGNAGNIHIRAGQLSLDNYAEITSETYGYGNSGDIRIRVRRLNLSGTSDISSTGSGDGEGGSISISAAESVGISGYLSGIYADTFNRGKGGEITVNTPDLTLDGGSIISASTTGDQNGGRISVNAGQIIIRNGSGIQAVTDGAGAGGNIDISAEKTVRISGTDDKGYKSGIYTNTLTGSGNAGNITISADEISLAQEGTISALSGGIGNAGEIRLNTNRLNLTGGAAISSETNGAGNGNNITVSAADSVYISGYLSGIFANTYQSGDGGNITISAPRMSVEHEAGISASTDRSGKAGEIRLNADTLMLNDKANITASSYGTGDGNHVMLNVSDLVMENKSYIFAFSTDTGRAGNIFLDAPHTVRMDNSAITTGSFNADGGNMAFHIGSRLYLSDSQITTSVKAGTGNGGNMTIDPQFVILNNSKILAQAYGGNGGNIHITADKFIRSSQSLVDASSKLGIDGSVEIDSPDENLSSMLTVLPTDFSDIEQWAVSPCEEQIDKPISHFFIRRYFIPPDLYEP